MYWFTEDDGEICLGLEPDTLATIVLSTGVFSSNAINKEVTQKEKALIGSIETADMEIVRNLAVSLFAN